MCSVEGKNGFDTEIKLCIVTRHCLTGTRDEREREMDGRRGRKEEYEMNGGR